MAKLSISRLLETSKMLSTKAGQELQEALQYLNDLADQTLRALRQGLTYNDNFKCEIMTATLKHNVEQKINYNGQQISEVRVQRTISTQYGYDSMLWYRNNSNELIVKVGFTGAPTGTVDTVLIIFYE
jgi:hypothetical protein